MNKSEKIIKEHWRNNWKFLRKIVVNKINKTDVLRRFQFPRKGMQRGHVSYRETLSHEPTTAVPLCRLSAFPILESNAALADFWVRWGVCTCGIAMHSHTTAHTIFCQFSTHNSISPQQYVNIGWETWKKWEPLIWKLLTRFSYIVLVRVSALIVSLNQCHHLWFETMMTLWLYQGYNRVLFSKNSYSWTWKCHSFDKMENDIFILLIKI